MIPYLNDGDFTLYNGDVLEVLREVPDESIHMVVTSPPYWGLRDYGTGAWEGGDAECDHESAKKKGRADYGFGEASQVQTSNISAGFTGYDARCKCGAHRIDNQLGLEPTPDEYVTRMVQVFREVRRVLRKDGTCWLNIGDSYISGQGGRQSGVGELPSTSRFDRPDPKARPELPNPPSGWAERAVTRRTYPEAATGLKPKDLAMMPARLALALQADGWYLRSEITWCKPNPMPESVTDRPTQATEKVYLLTKSPRYFYDAEAVREPHESTRWGGRYSGPSEDWKNGSRIRERDDRDHYPIGGRNLRNWWQIATEPYPEAHFATYPTELVRRCILAGTSERGCCPECGAPWVRFTDGASYYHTRDETRPKQKYSAVGQGHGGVGRGPKVNLGASISQTIGWRPSCDHDGLAPIASTVLDPFLGSGTSAFVARKLGRKCIGIELSQSYCELAARRTAQLSLEADVVV